MWFGLAADSGSRVCGDGCCPCHLPHLWYMDMKNVPFQFAYNTSMRMEAKRILRGDEGIICHWAWPMRHSSRPNWSNAGISGMNPKGKELHLIGSIHPHLSACHPTWPYVIECRHQRNNRSSLFIWAAPRWCLKLRTKFKWLIRGGKAAGEAGRGSNGAPCSDNDAW